MSVPPVNQTPSYTLPEDRDMEEVLRGLEAKAKGLPKGERDKFLAHIRMLAEQIVIEIRQLRACKCSGEAIKQEAGRLYAHLQVAGEKFLAECAHFVTQVRAQNQRFDSFEERLSKLQLPAKEFTAPTPSVDLDFDDMVHGVYKMDLEERMAAARLMAAGVEAVNNVVAEGVKKACDSTDLGKKVCAVVKEFGAFVARDMQMVASDICAIMPDLCERFSRDHQALAHLLHEQYDIPLAVGQQYSKDATTLAVTFLASVPLGKPVTTGLAGSTKGVLTPVFGKVKQFQDARGVENINKALVKNGAKVEGMVDFGSRMRQVAERIKDYSSGTQKNSVKEFIQTLPGGPSFVQDSAKVLPQIAQGRSGASIFFVGHDGLDTLYVVKSFPAMIAHEGKFGREILAYETYKSLKMAHMEFPRLLKVGKYTATEGTLAHGLLAMTPVRGHSLAVMLDNFAKTTGQARVEGLKSFSPPMEKAGRALAELHRKSIQSTPASSHFISQEVEAMRGLYGVVQQEAKSAGMQFTFTDAHLARTITAFKYNSGGASLVHGDAHLPNFFWNKATNTLTAIDTSSLIKSLDHSLKPIGSGAKDFVQWSEMLRRYGARTGLTPKEVEGLREVFHAGYKAEFGYKHTQEAIHFYEVFWKLRSLNSMFTSKTQFLEEVKEVIAQLNKLAK